MKQKDTADAALDALVDAFDAHADLMREALHDSDHPRAAKVAFVDTFVGLTCVTAGQPKSTNSEDIQKAIQEDVQEAMSHGEAREFWSRVPFKASILHAAFGACYVDPDRPTDSRPSIDLNLDCIARLKKLLGRTPDIAELAIWLGTYQKLLLSRAPIRPREQCRCGRIEEAGRTFICVVCKKCCCAFCAEPVAIDDTCVYACPECVEEIPASWRRNASQ